MLICALAWNSSHPSLFLSPQHCLVGMACCVVSGSTDSLAGASQKAELGKSAPVCPRNRPGTRADTTDISLNSQVSPVTVAFTGDHYAAFPWLKFETVWPKRVCIIMGY